MKITATIFFAFFTHVLFSQEVKPEVIKVGDLAPTFSINKLDGETFNTHELKGKVIYLNFFATWCGPCMKELPIVESDIWKDIRDTNFVMLAIAREHTVDDIVEFKMEKGFTLPMAADTNRAIYSLFAPQYIPRNIVIDRNGKIVYTEKNYDPEEFSKMVELIKLELAH